MLPASGVSYPMLVTVGVGYLLAAVAYARLASRTEPTRLR